MSKFYSDGKERDAKAFWMKHKKLKHWFDYQHHFCFGFGCSSHWFLIGVILWLFCSGCFILLALKSSFQNVPSINQMALKYHFQFSGFQMTCLKTHTHIKFDFCFCFVKSSSCIKFFFFPLLLCLANLKKRQKNDS